MSVEETNPSEGRPQDDLTDRTTELQSKLYQTAKGDPHRRFHALYDKLYSSYVLESAWEQVRRNQGAAGIDGQTIEEIERQDVPAFLEGIAQTLREKSYRPQPVRRVEIPKGDGRVRPLGIPTVRDRVVQAAAKIVLEPIFEADFEGISPQGGTSFGFRPGRGAHDALEAVAENARRGLRWVVDADIEQFFDTLDHERLMAALRVRISDGAMLRLIYRWLKAGYLLEGVVYETDQGSPQGGVLSPLLANIYLHSLDWAFAQQKVFTGRLVRYADDFVIQCGNEAQAQRALAWVQEQIARLGLCLHPEKTRVVNDREAGFDFLGFHHRRVLSWRTGRETYGVSRWPSRKACARFRDRVREVIGLPGHLRTHWRATVGALNRYVTGWCHYYRHGQSTRSFSKLDEYLLERLSRTIARAQPKGEGRKRRHWETIRAELRQREIIPRLTRLQRGKFRAYRGPAKVQWRAV
jgi:RNA-directed DNA polymerase